MDADNNSSGGFISQLQNWAMYPITNQMDLLDIVLTTIIITTVTVIWIMILKHLTSVVDVIEGV